MAEQQEAVVEQPSYLEMSDEDMMNATPPESTPVVEVIPPPEKEVVEEVVEIIPPSTAVTDEGAGTATEVGDTVVDTPEPKEVKPPVADEKVEVEQVQPVVNFEAEYNRLLAPFKANGRDIQVKSVDDALGLMQMGANYNKKMAGLKPHLKLMKLLENNGLLDEGKLSFLIELDKKSPEAINKLVQESGISPMDFDAEKAGEYRPKIHTVDDREIELDTVLDDIQSTPTYTRTLNIVSKEWDGASKQAIAGSPQLLKVINDHVERGIYDLIAKEVEGERMFGRLDGMSDLDAYRKVGDSIQARGGFDHLGTAPGRTATTPVIVTPKPKKPEDDALNEKRRAASSSKPAVVSSSIPKEFNPLALSDADFGKFADTHKFR